eukprot:CAMPEP_0204576194 /NCGR_PEP_ID=MMETSP0661-20131031/41633_1 /ASSEMBLY_ACC=CAM_ASM_000606 /TAXON_ID=109239 /ORGANISM="Alexandrium margalefi, Strain AMGDE01CS-322" /LENGTH=360 /DNA_ID=CAMNT_0051584917 /DNA_START=54 /DNA_END=1136 /DNA_ORIENTATION=+
MGAAMGASQTRCCRAASDKFEVSGDDAILSLSEEKLAARAQEPLSSMEVRLVKDTWGRVCKLGEERVGVALFKNVFKRAPEALQLFPFRSEPNILTYETPRLKAHAVRVVGVVDTAVQGLGNLPALVPTLQELGLRHQGYGVVRAHYDVVGGALLATLEMALGELFTPRARLAWTKVWGVVSGTMLSCDSEAADGHPEVCEPEPEAKAPFIPGRLSDAELALIKRSWATAGAPGAEAVGVALFRHIFAIAPGALQLFPFRDDKDVFASERFKAHAARVVTAVDLAVSSLDTPEELAVMLQGLGQRHVGYGVLAPHYDVVGQALIATLRDGLGKAFTPELEAVWMKVWVVISSAMQGPSSP